MSAAANPLDDKDCAVTEAVHVPVRRLDLDPDLPLPAYAHPGDAGADLVAAEDVVLGPGERALVHTGVAVALPEGFVGWSTRGPGSPPASG